MELNVTKFKEFLDKNCKNDYDLDEYIKDLGKQVGATGLNQYELSRYETKSGRPELFDLD